MALDTGYHAVVVGHNLIVQRIVISNTIQNSIIATGIHMIKIAVAFTDDGFPNQELSGHQVGHLVSIRSVLRTPLSCDGAGVAILENSTDKQLDFICGNGAVVG